MPQSKPENFDPTIRNLVHSSFHDEMTTIGITPDQNSPNVINPQVSVIDISHIEENEKKNESSKIKWHVFDEVKRCHNERRQVGTFRKLNLDSDARIHFAIRARQND